MNTEDVKRIFNESLNKAKKNTLKQIHTMITTSAENNKSSVYVKGEIIETIKKFNIMDYIVATLISEGFQVEPKRVYTRNPTLGFPEPWESIEINLYSVFNDVIKEVTNEDAKRK